MARKYDSEETKQKILSSSVRLFIEKGYHETTMTEILHDAGVSGSSFHSIFHTKDGVLAELTEFMFENQFGVAEKIHGSLHAAGIDGLYSQAYSKKNRDDFQAV